MFGKGRSPSYVEGFFPFFEDRTFTNAWCKRLKHFAVTVTSLYSAYSAFTCLFVYGQLGHFTRALPGFVLFIVHYSKYSTSL